MILNNIALEVGKSYNIDSVIKELDKYPEVRLGHIYAMVLHEHLYHQGKKELEDLSKRIKKIIASGGKEYEKIGKRFVATSDITILSIEDPYARYEKYGKFYNELLPIITKGIEESKKDSIASPTEAIISEARKLGILIEDEQEFLDGLSLFFKRKGIDTSAISSGKFILFEKRGPLTPKKMSPKEKETTEKEYEKYKEYTGFYESFFKDVAEGISVSQKEDIAASIVDIIGEVKKLGYPVEGKEKDILQGMKIYFGIRGISVDIIDNDYATFKKK